MTRAALHKQERAVPHNPEAPVLSLILSMADTTWRMFVPATLFVGLGLWADLNWGTKPWLTFVGTILGLAAGVYLIRKQLRNY